MNIDEFIRNNGLMEVPNPNYNPRAKKNKQPKTISIKNESPSDDYVSGGMAHSINDRWSVESDITEKYRDYGITYNRIHDLDKELAEAQSNWAKVGNSLLQTVGSEFALGTLKGASDLMGGIFSTLTGQIFKPDYNYSNQVSELLERGQEWIREEAPIHVDPDLNMYNGGLTDIGWLASGTPSIISSLTLLLPARGASWGASKLFNLASKGLKARKAAKAVKAAEEGELLSRAAKMEKVGETNDKMNWFAKQIYNPQYAARWKKGAEVTFEGALMRTMENYQEARQTYTQSYQDVGDALSKMDDEQYAAWCRDNQEFIQENQLDINNRDEVARAIASKAADRTFKLDYVNTLFDIVQLYGLRDIGKLASRVTHRTVDRAERFARQRLGKGAEEIAEFEAKRGTLVKAKDNVIDFFTGASRTILEESTEGIEEAINYIASQEGLRVGKMMLDKESELTRSSFWNDRLSNYVNDPEFGESAFWGVIGGVVFQGLGSSFNAYRASLERKNKAKENEKNKVNPNPNGKDVNDFIGLWDTAEVKAAKAAISRKTDRYNQLNEALSAVKENKNPYRPNGNDYFEFENEAEKDYVINKLKNEYITNLVIDAKSSGTYYMLESYLTDKNVKEAFSKLEGVGLENVDGFVNELVSKAKTISKRYDNELARVNRQVTAINKNYKDEDYIPVDYVQTIALGNLKTQLSLDNIRDTQATINSHIASKISELSDRITVNDAKDTEDHLYLSYLQEMYSRLEANKVQLKSGNEVDADGTPLSGWRIEENLRSINRSQKLYMDEIKRVSEESNLNKFANIFAVLKRSKGYERFNGKYYFNEEIKQTDEEIIKEYEDLFEGNNADVSAISTTAKAFQEKIRNLNSEKGLRGQSQELWDMYAQLADLRVREIAEKSKLHISQREILQEADRLHNSRNELRIELLDKARTELQKLYQKYKNKEINGKNGGELIKDAITAAYKRNPDELRTIAQNFTDKNDNGGSDGNILIEAIGIINFGYAANEEIYRYIFSILEYADYEDQIRQQSGDDEVVQEDELEGEENNDEGGEENNDEGGKEQGGDGEEGQRNIQINDGLPTITEVNTDILPKGGLAFDADGRIVTLNLNKDGGIPIATFKTEDGKKVYVPVISALDDVKLKAKCLTNKVLFNFDDTILTDGAKVTIFEDPQFDVIEVEGKETYKLRKPGVLKISITQEDGSEKILNDVPETRYDGLTIVQPEQTPPVEDNGGGEGGSAPRSKSRKEIEANTDAMAQLVAPFISNAMSRTEQVTDEELANIRQKVEEGIASKNLDISASEIDNYLNPLLASYKRMVNRRLARASKIDDNANEAVLAARLEEANVGLFHSFFTKACDAFIDEYVKNTIVPTITEQVLDDNGYVIATVQKKVVRLSDLLRICNEAGGLEGVNTARTLYKSLIRYLESDEGKAKYSVVNEKENSFNKLYTKAITSEEERLEEDVPSNKFRIDIYTQFKQIDEDLNTLEERYEDIDERNTRKAELLEERENLLKTIRSIKKGDKIKLRRLGKELLAVNDNGDVIGRIPEPETSELGNHYKYNQGWRTEVSKDVHGEVVSEYKDLVVDLFTNEDDFSASVREALTMIMQYGSIYKMPPQLQGQIIDKTFGFNNYKNHLYEIQEKSIQAQVDLEREREDFIRTHSDEEYEEYELPTDAGNLMYVTGADFNSQFDDQINALNGLFQLFRYATDISQGISKQDSNTLLNYRISKWFNKMYDTYNDYYLIADEENADVISKIDGDVNRIVENVTDESYDRLKRPKDALAEPERAKLAIYFSDSGITVSDPSTIDDNLRQNFDADNFTPGSTLVALYGSQETPALINAAGCRTTNSNDLNSPEFSKLYEAVRVNLYNNIVGYLDGTSTGDDFVNNFRKLFRCNRSREDNYIPVFSPMHGTLDVVTGTARTDKGREWPYVEIQYNFGYNPNTNKSIGCRFRLYKHTNYSKPAFVLTYQDGTEDENGHTKNVPYLTNRNGGNIIPSVSSNTSFASLFTKYLFKDHTPRSKNPNFINLEDILQVSIDKKGIDLDNGKDVNDGFIRPKRTLNGKEVEINIPAIYEKKDKSFTLTVPSYSDFLIGQNLIRLNTEVKDGSNYGDVTENLIGKNQLRLVVDVPIAGRETQKRERTSEGLSEYDVIKDGTSPELYSKLKTILVSKSNTKQKDLLTEMFGKEWTDDLYSIARKCGIDGNIIPDKLSFVERFNIWNQDENRWEGNVAETNIKDVDVFKHRFNIEGEQSGLRIKARNTIVGTRWLNSAASERGDVRAMAFRKLIHENIHQELSKTNKREVLEDFSQLAEDFWNKVLEYKNKPLTDDLSVDEQIKIKSAKQIYEGLKYYRKDGKFTNVGVEEFITEGITSRDFMEFMNRISVTDVGEQKESLFSKFMNLIAKLFGWTIRDGSMYQKFFNKVSTIGYTEESTYSPELKAAIKQFDDYRDWQKEHITFDEASHKYRYDGADVDMSITEYSHLYHGIPLSNEDDNPYAFASVLGNDVDAIVRDYFLGKDIFSINYPNFNNKRKKEIEEDLQRLKKYFDDRFVTYKVITDEVRLIGKVNINGEMKTICGTMDMLVIDNNGIPHIFDMKAKRKEWTKGYKHEGKDKTDDELLYSFQQNGYRQLLENCCPIFEGKTNDMNLIWFLQSYPDVGYGISYKINGDKTVTIKESNNTLLLKSAPGDMWVTPHLEEDVKKSLIPINKEDVLTNISPLNANETVVEDTNQPNEPENEDTNVNTFEDEDINDFGGFDNNTDGIVSFDSLFDDNDEEAPFSRTEEGIELYDLYAMAEPSKQGTPIISLDSFASKLDIETQEDFKESIYNGEINLICK